MDFPRLASQDSKELNQGFTLLELIVSIAIFSIVVIAATSIMMSVFRAQAKAVAIKNVLDNARFSLELMTRELRTATGISFTTTPPPGCPRNGLAFTSHNQGSSQERFYYWEDTDGDGVRDAMMKVAMSAGSIDCTAVPPQRFTSDEVIVDSWVIRLLGNAVGGADGQPSVLIIFKMHGQDTPFGVDTSINLQTAVTMRSRDL